VDQSESVEVRNRAWHAVLLQEAIAGLVAKPARVDAERVDHEPRSTDSSYTTHKASWCLSAQIHEKTPPLALTADGRARYVDYMQPRNRFDLADQPRSREAISSGQRRVKHDGMEIIRHEPVK
jgi:hypothetical protein